MAAWVLNAQLQVIKLPVRDGGSNCFGLRKRVLEVGDLLLGRFSASTRRRDLICRGMSLIPMWGMLTTASGGIVFPQVLPSLMNPGSFCGEVRGGTPPLLQAGRSVARRFAAVDVRPGSTEALAAPRTL